MHGTLAFFLVARSGVSSLSDRARERLFPFLVGACGRSLARYARGAYGRVGCGLEILVYCAPPFSGALAPPSLITVRVAHVYEILGRLYRFVKGQDKRESPPLTTEKPNVFFS